MKTNTLKTTIIALVAIGFIAIGSSAFAGNGMGNRNDGFNRPRRCAEAPCYRQNPRLTDEQRQQLATEQEAFFNATRDQRQDLRAKNLGLRAEMAKRNPDMKIASGIQKEISNLRADLDQKRLTHIFKIRQIDPEAGMGFMGPERGGRGGHGGYGGRGPCNAEYGPIAERQ